MAKKKTADVPTVANVLDGINAKFGVNAIVRMDAVPEVQYDTVSTGSIALDKALGVGGLPRGRIVELYGKESSGKTTIALHAVADAQRQGLQCAFIDAEHALDVKYAEALGVDVPSLLISQPDCGEEALEIADMLVKSGQVGVVVIDSVAALVPRAELDGEMGQAHVGLQARMMSQALRKLKGVANEKNVLLVFINQTRLKIGVTYGSPVTTPGGEALKFYASVRLEVARIAKVKNGEQVVAGRTRVKVVKNKVAAPFTEAEFDIEFGVGISRPGEIIEMGVECGVVDRSGAWISYGGEKLGQGKENAKAFLSENPDVMSAIASAILSK